jgi:SlyX protein
MSSPDIPNADQRLRNMEERLTYQQRMIEELNEVVLRHEQRLEHVGREATRLADRLQQLADVSPGNDLPHEKPPHY